MIHVSQAHSPKLLLQLSYDCVNGDCNNLVLNAVQRLTPDLKLVGDEEHPALSEIIVSEQPQLRLTHSRCLVSLTL